MKELSNWTEKKYMKLYKKYVASRTWFVIFNIIAFTMIAMMIILNVFAIKKNEHFRDVVPLYVAISILTGFVGLATSIISFFTLNKNANKYKAQSIEIKEECKMYKAKEGKYKDKLRDEVLIDSVMLIISNND